MPMPDHDYALYFLIGTVAVIFLFGLLVKLSVFINYFSRELKYLNNEILRTHGAERGYWIRKKRRLWFSLIPFVNY